MLDRHNDNIQIYVKRDQNGWVLTDDSFTLDDLAMSGCEITSPRRGRWLEQVLAGFGVSIDDKDALLVKAADGDFCQKNHFLLQAILAVSDLFYLTDPNVENFFFEDVSEWLDKHEIRNLSRVIVKGKSLFSHQFDFVVPKSKAAGERLIKLVNNPTQSIIESALFAWLDAKEKRTEASAAYIIVNDESSASLDEWEAALEACGMKLLPWSQRNDFIPLLAA